MLVNLTRSSNPILYYSYFTAKYSLNRAMDHVIMAIIINISMHHNFDQTFSLQVPHRCAILSLVVWET